LASQRAATVIGILGLLLGSCGASSAGYEMVMPRMLDMQREFMATIQATQAKRAPDADVVDPFPTELFEKLQGWMEVPESVRPWFPLSGLVGLTAFAALGFAGLLILLQNPLGARILPGRGARLGRCSSSSQSRRAHSCRLTAPGARERGSAVVIAVAARYSDLAPPR
jgi:hypothetical protein